ncbi:MAG: sialate O-acetylesterase [Prolixibacteraceae bacterium]|jgi:hypothetical protein
MKQFVMKHFLILILLLPVFSQGQNKIDHAINFPKQTLYVKSFPAKKNVWVFIMAGQSNMAGRALVEPQDTIPNPRVISINKDNRWVYAKEPLHFYQPKLTGLDCGMSFAKDLLPHLNKNTVIVLLPCAVGGSSISYWLNDSTFNGIHLKSNFKEKVDLAKKIGVIKGILWHQGESDAFEDKIPVYGEKLKELFAFFRSYTGNENLPILLGELGTYPVGEKMKQNWPKITEIIRQEAGSDKYCALVHTGDLKPKEDFIHFDSPSQRILGKRYTEAYLKLTDKGANR